MKKAFKSEFLTRIPQIGRPKKFQSVPELEEMIQDYFGSCFIPMTEKKFVMEPYRDHEDGEMMERRVKVSVNVLDTLGQQVYQQVKPFTVSGLALHLGTTRDTLIDYEKDAANAEFSDTIKRAKAYIQNFAEERLYGSTQVAGVIFALKNNHGWQDKQEIDYTTKGKEINPSVIQTKVQDMLGAPIQAPGETASVVPDSVKQTEDDN